MAKLCPFNQFFDDSGNPLSSGLVYTYITGTSTAKTTYTDASEATALPNPVVLSSGGRKEIWLATDSAYRLVIKDADGTQIGSTIDGVIGTTATAVFAGGADVDVTGFSVITTSGNIELTPVSGSTVSINGAYSLPTTAGEPGQSLVMDTATTTTWGSTSLELIADASPQLAGPLDTNAHNISFDTGYGIIDENSNEQLLFTTTASAVNYLTITNAATGNSPIISATGSDADIGITLTPKGAGSVDLGTSATVTTLTGTTVTAITVKATDVSGAGALTFKDHTNTTTLAKMNGVASAVNYLNITNSTTGNAVSVAPAGSDSNIALTLAGKGSGVVKLSGITYPTADGSSGDVVTTNGSGVLSLAPTGLAASKAEMEAASSTTVFVTPGRTQNHPGVAKAWIDFTGGATPTINASHNITSITRNSSTSYTFNFTTAFSSSTAYACNASRIYALNGDYIYVASLAAGSATFTLSAADIGSSRCSIQWFGDQ